MPDFIDQCVSVLRTAGHDLREGLTSTEIAGVQHEFGFTFSPDHAALLTAVLPVGTWWIDWRQADRADLRSILDWPVDGTMSDVELDGFWPASWGPRPEEVLAALDVARVRMAAVPTLVPIYSHRYMPAAPAPHLAPVFSVYHTDVIYYGKNLLDYLLHEFVLIPPHRRTRGGKIARIDFWSSLAEGAESPAL